MTELAVHQPQNDLMAQMDYARAVSTASMLPDNYRGKPADIMLAVGLGQSMGLSPAESLYRISVIKGKPTASAELVAANVRKAGHRLRVSIEPGKATATIVRADDPDFEFTVVRDAAWAKQMGLSDQPNYRKQGDTMLSWRAITAAARLACPEALYGVAYTPDEMMDDQQRGAAFPAATVPQSGADRMGAMLGKIEDSPGTTENESDEPMLNPRGGLAKRMFATLNEIGITEKDERLEFVSATLGRQITTSSDMTDREAEHVIVMAEASKPVEAEVVDELDPTLAPEWNAS